MESYGNEIEPMDRDDDFTGMTPDKYRPYIKSWSWKKRRWAFFSIYDYECGMCGEEDKSMHLHHTTYENIGNEQESELIPLCGFCHWKVHWTFQTKQADSLFEATLMYLGTNEFWYHHLTEGKENGN